MIQTWSPRTLEEALFVRAEHPDATVVAGGTDVMVAVNFGRLEPRSVLDLSHVDELKVWQWDTEAVSVGAGVTFGRIATELDAQTALAEAAATVGSPQIRAAATLGGNVATGSPAGDGIAALAAYDAKIVLAREGGHVRRLPWDQFFLGPKRTALAEDELVVGAEWEPADGPGTFAKVGTRGAMVIAVASVCVQLDEPTGSARIALGSVGPTVLRAESAEAVVSTLDWNAPDPHGITLAATLAASIAHPIDDVRGSAAYRRRATEILVRRALGWTLGEREQAVA